jgi:hypothetical protein
MTISDPRLPVFVGVDASVRHDTTGIVASAYDGEPKRVRVVWHKCFKPAGGDIDFAALENEILGLRDRFNLRVVWFDPYQMQAVSQRLAAAGIATHEFNQTQGNLTLAAGNLYELVTAKNIAFYESDEIRSAVLNCAVIESPRGFRLAKERASAKIDLAAALSFAALACVKSITTRDSFTEAMAWLQTAKPFAEGDQADTAGLARGKRAYESARQRAIENNRLCHKCKQPIRFGETYFEPMAGTYQHAACPETLPVEVDSFGNEIKPGKPDLLDLVGLRL